MSLFRMYCPDQDHYWKSSTPEHATITSSSMDAKMLSCPDHDGCPSNDHTHTAPLPQEIA